MLLEDPAQRGCNDQIHQKLPCQKRKEEQMWLEYSIYVKETTDRHLAEMTEICKRARERSLP